VNVSVWETYRALHDYTYRSPHRRFTRDRRDWFVRLPGFTTALWWVAAGERPSLEEGVARLAVLNRDGPSPRAFSLLHRFASTGRRVDRAAR
jgi:hypothetical protein